MKNKTILIYILLILIIVFSFAIPKMITKMQDKKILSAQYSIDKKIQTLNENAKSIGLIETIYSKYNTDKYDVQVSDIISETEMIDIQQSNGDFNISIKAGNGEDILIRFQELMKINIVEQDFYKYCSSKFISYRIWDYDNGNTKYRVIKIFTQDALEELIASIEIENETNKIIAYTVNKEYSNVNQDTLLEYVKYLELDTIFNDWEYKDNELNSKTAGIKITTNTDYKYIYVKVVPLES